MREIADLLNEVRQRVQILSENLPTLVDPANISYKAKIPFKVISFREMLIWRAEELSRTAIQMYESEDLASAITLTRAFTETVAAIWYLMKLVEAGYTEEFDSKMQRLLLGHKRKDMDMPEAINVLTFLEKAEKEISGIKSTYEMLSEYAHPNWAGTHFLYASNDHEKLTVSFGKNPRKSDNHKRMGISCLLGNLIIFELSYNKFSDILPAFIEACERAIDSETIEK